MAFEQKRMNEADMALYASWGIRNPLTAAMMHSGEWTVDAENDIYFVSFGGRGSHPDVDNYPPNYFLLRYKGLNIFFDGREKTETLVEKESWRTIWTVDMSIPKILNNKLGYLFQIIEDALLCQEIAWSPNFKGRIEFRVIANSLNFVELVV